MTRRAWPLRSNQIVLGQCTKSRTESIETQHDREYVVSFGRQSSDRHLHELVDAELDILIQVARPDGREGISARDERADVTVEPNCHIVRPGYQSCSRIRSTVRPSRPAMLVMLPLHL